MKSLKEQIESKCRHFTGVSNKTCEAGVCYMEVADMDKTATERFPCFREGESVPCEKREWFTEQEVNERLEAHKESTARTMKAMAAVVEDAEKRGFKKGKGGGAKIKCPCCESGELGYSVASINGHIWGKCST